MALMLAGAVIVAGFAWLAITGLLARNELGKVARDVRTLRTELRQGQLTQARSTAADVLTHSHRAELLTAGPVWSAAAAIPGGRPLGTVRTIAEQVNRLAADVVPGLVSATTQLDPAHIRDADGRIDVSRISAVTPVLAGARRNLASTQAAIEREPTRSWLHGVDSARSGLLTQLGSVGRSLRSAQLASQITPAMLGAQGTRRYLVAFQNDAEARGTGGIPGAFAILAADDGRVSFERFEPDTTLIDTSVDLDLGSDYSALFAADRTTSFYPNTNLSPHFPYAAKIWIAMWQHHSGEHLNGAIAVDPTVLSYLLSVTGPATLPDGTTVSAHNVVTLTQSTVYAKFPRADEVTARKQYLMQIAQGVSKKLLAPGASAAGLVRASAKAAGERRLLVYSTDPVVESQLEQTSLSGALPRTAEPYAGLSIVNNGGNKLDYYLHRTLDWQAQGCGALRSVTATVGLRNDAPATGLSPYVTERSDDPGYPTRPGDNSEEISYYATAGAQLDAVEVNGQQVGAQQAQDLGHPVFTIDVEVPRGKQTTVVFHLSEPNSTHAPIVLRQPLVRPMKVTVGAQPC